MGAVPVVIVGKLGELVLQVTFVPKKGSVQVLSANGADESFNKGMSVDRQLQSMVGRCHPQKRHLSVLCIKKVISLKPARSRTHDEVHLVSAWKSLQVCQRYDDVHLLSIRGCRAGDQAHSARALNAVSTGYSG